MKLSKQNLYWLLQLVGWGVPFGLNATAKMLTSGGILSTSYILIENATLFLFGILGSHLFRYVYKKHIKWQGWSWLKFFATAAMIIIVALGITLLTEMTCSWAYAIFENAALERSFSDYLITFVNSVVYLCFWLTLYLAITYFMRNQQMKMERLQLENNAKESQLNTLKGQINPHFMFNSLNNIRGLMLEDVDKARDMLTQLSDMLRFSLSRKNDNFVPLREELAIVHNYISLSKIQLEDRLEYQEHIEEQLRDVEVPPMLIQMLVENAIKHGIASLKNGGTVTLEVKEEADVMIILVKNDGVLHGKRTGTQIGVQNIVKRLELLYENRSDFALSQIGQQVHATVRIPKS
jgi:two-component system LytT family sensor kinase